MQQNKEQRQDWIQQQGTFGGQHFFTPHLLKSCVTQTLPIILHPQPPPTEEVDLGHSVATGFVSSVFIPLNMTQDNKEYFCIKDGEMCQDATVHWTKQNSTQPKQIQTE